MARQTGLVRYSGSMGGIRHFKIKGLEGDFAGLNGGPTGEQIKNDEAFIRTRENMTEFGGCASAAKTIRIGLAQLMRQMSDPRLTGRLTAMMKEVQYGDTVNPRGQRSILISSAIGANVGLNYNINASFVGVFNAPYTLTNTPTRDSATFTIPAFNPANYINAPAGATHFRLINAINVISNWEYDSNSGKYYATDPTLSELNDVQYSTYLDLSAVTTPITITTTLPGSPTLTPSVAVMNNIGIEFYQEVSGNYYLFASGNALLGVTLF
jgi:hypothetical protein